MSVEKVTRKDGSIVWRVRWRENDRNRSGTYSRREDARAADVEIIRRKRLGTLAGLDAGRESLDEFVQTVWAPVHAAQLAPRTRATYSTVYAKHIGPYLGGLQLRALTADVIAGWQADRLKADVEHVSRPYDLRHSFASLLLAEGRTIHYVAKQLGHAPSLTLDVYGHTIDELEIRDRVDAEAEIRAAREALVPRSYLSGP